MMDAYPARAQEPARHSGVGVASFVLSILSGIGLFAVIVAAAVLQSSRPGVLNDEKSAEAIVVGAVVLGDALLALIGAGLGIACVMQREHKRIFGTLGLVFSAMVLLSVAGLFILGSMSS